MDQKLKNILIGEFSLKRLLASAITIPLAIYLGLGLYAYFFSDHLIFQPPGVAVTEGPSFLKLKTSDGREVSAKLIEMADADYTVIYAHGNAENLATLEPFLAEYSASGFNILAFDYAGYGLSPGSPTEENSYRDIEAAYDYLINEKGLQPDQVLLHGRSLGGAIAIDLASKRSCGGLIAESTFTSAFPVLTRYKIYPFDRFKSISKLQSVKCPVFLIHGKKDDLIHFRHAEALFSEAKEPKFFFWVEDASHNDLVDKAGDAYFEAIRNFSTNLRE